MEEAKDDLVVYTTSEILNIGLRLVNFSKKRISRAGMKRNLTRFRGFFGVKPVVVAKVWYDLQTTTIEEARVPKASLCLEHCLMALHHLKRYPTELEREPLFDIDPSEGRYWVWYYIEKFRSLKFLKIRWPVDNYKDDLWILTVDGVDCWINEPTHPEWSQDKDYFSQKFNKAGLKYELGISLSESKLIWMNGPFKAGASDNSIFQNHGLLQKLRETGKRCIADGNYIGNPMQASTPNNEDSAGVKIFKARATKRHETFNGLIKTFECLTGRFRHDASRFAQCFEACCVLGQCSLEAGQPLYDILIEQVANA